MLPRPSCVFCSSLAGLKMPKSNFTSKSQLTMLELVSSTVATLPVRSAERISSSWFDSIKMKNNILDLWTRLAFVSYLFNMFYHQVWDCGDLWTSLHLVCHSRGSKERKFGHNCTYCKGFIVGANILSIDASDGASVVLLARSIDRSCHSCHCMKTSILAVVDMSDFLLTISKEFKPLDTNISPLSG